MKVRGYKINIGDVLRKKVFLTLGFPIDKKRDVVCSGFIVYAKAEKTYHGSKNYRTT